ncbi:putative cytochrome 78A7-like [Capsicum annuum]|nr:putative cytochrome 78A7-like [Capsicum annuum]
MVFWEGYVSDEVMGTFAPIVVYWLYAGLYQLLPPMDKYRLHTRKEEDDKNLVPLSSVVKGVLLQQFFQATVAHLLFLYQFRDMLELEGFEELQGYKTPNGDYSSRITYWNFKGKLSEGSVASIMVKVGVMA